MDQTLARKILSHLYLLLILLMLGCGVPVPENYNYYYDVSVPVDQRLSKFRLIEGEEQIQIALAGSRIEPPDNYYLHYLESQGEKYVPFLMQELEKPEAYASQHWRVIASLEAIHLFHKSLRNETVLISKLKKIASTIEDESYRRMTVKIIDEIEKNPGFGEPGNPTYEQSKKDRQLAN